MYTFSFEGSVLEGNVWDPLSSVIIWCLGPRLQMPIRCHHWVSDPLWWHPWCPKVLPCVLRVTVIEGCPGLLRRLVFSVICPLCLPPRRWVGMNILKIFSTTYLFIVILIKLTQWSEIGYRHLDSWACKNYIKRQAKDELKICSTGHRGFVWKWCDLYR